MKIRTILFLLALFLCIPFNILLTHVLKGNTLVILLSLAYLLYVPGFLIILILKIKFRDTWQYILHSLGISITYIYLLGLLSSLALPYFGYDRPLDLQPGLYWYSLFNILLIIGAAKQNWKESFSVDFDSRFMNILAYIISILISGISIAGSFYLNNGGSYVITFSWFVVLILFFIFLSFFKSEKWQFLNCNFIFVLSLSLLWSLSARSWHITGWDIVQEIFVAKNTQDLGLWSMTSLNDAYNACLSINILPTILSNFSTLQIEVLFKFVYPFIFSHFTLNVYFLIKKYTNKSVALFAVFYIVSQPSFIQPMVALARQEIAFFFFSLLLSTIFTNEVQRKSKIILVVSYIFGLVLSHYSTTYVTVILFSITYSIILFFKLLRLIPVPAFLNMLSGYQSWIKNYKSELKLWMLFSLILSTFCWYFIITQIGWDLKAVIQNNLNSISALFSGNQKSQEVQRTLSTSGSSLVTTPEDLVAYQKENSVALFNLPEEYLNDISNKYPLKPLYETYQQPSILNKDAQLVHLFLNILKTVLKYLVVIGSFLVFLKTLINNQQNLDFVLFSVVSTFILLVMLLHPSIGLQYNISRLLIQLLIFLSPTLIVTLQSLLFPLNHKVQKSVISLVLILSFFHLQGFLTPIIGGLPPMILYNKGTDYEKFYIFQEELSSADWLQKNRNLNNTLYGDDLTVLRLRKESLFFPKRTIIPVVISNNGDAYIYVSATNKVLHKAQVNFNNKFLTFEYPIKFLDEQRNLVYSNKKSAIYK